MMATNENEITKANSASVLVVKESMAILVLFYEDVFPLHSLALIDLSSNPHKIERNHKSFVKAYSCKGSQIAFSYYGDTADTVHAILT